MTEVHPDRAARTLAEREFLLEAGRPWLGQAPGTGSADARLDLKILRSMAEQVLAERGTAAARARLAGLDTPDLLAGTVQDGTARGLAVAYEEAISLCAPARTPPAANSDPRVVTGPALRRIKDLLVASGGARMRFSRKRGLLFVDRTRELNLEDCVAFEDQRDQGTLDAFSPVPGERPRLYSPAFLTPVRFEQGDAFDRLDLAGTLGSGDRSHPCALALIGHKHEPVLRVRIAIDNRLDDHRLRIRFWRFPDPPGIHCATTPPLVRIDHGDRWFWTTTLLRACGRLQVGDALVAVPSAQCKCRVEHEFLLGPVAP